MVQKHFSLGFICTLLIFLVACNGEPATKDANYDTTKKMVVDILQTEDGKKALNEIISDEKMKEQLVIDSAVVKKSINQALASEKGKKAWEKLFEDPKFVESYSKSMSEEFEKLMKNLLKDPDYQKQMIELLQNPEVDKQMLKVMKSQQFQKHMEEVMQQTFESPLFQAKIQDILLKAAEKQGGGQKGQGQGGGGGQGGGEGGGGDSGGGGGGG